MKKSTPKPPIVIPQPRDRPGALKALGGSVSDSFNNIVTNQALAALWLGNSDEEARAKQYQAVIAVMMGVKPKDELEGMLAAQLAATHHAAMESYRRAMIPEQTAYGHDASLKHGVKVSQVYAALLQALDKHRGKEQQRVKVEHVHIYQGGQAIVGAVTQGVGHHRISRINLMHHLSPTNQARRCRARSKRTGKPCKAPAVKGWLVCRMHGAGGGAPQGNRNALRHGRYTADAIAVRQQLRALLRESRELLDTVE
jgi:hypothetical protein